VQGLSDVAGMLCLILSTRWCCGCAGRVRMLSERAVEPGQLFVESSGGQSAAAAMGKEGECHLHVSRLLTNCSVSETSTGALRPQQ
jgi:hypothetical protein